MAGNKFPATEEATLGSVVVFDGKHEVRYTMISAARDGRPVQFRFEVRKRQGATSEVGPDKVVPTAAGKKLRPFEFEVGVGDAEVVPCVKGPGGRRLLLTVLAHDAKTDAVKVLASLASARIPAILKKEREGAPGPDPVPRMEGRAAPPSGPQAAPANPPRPDDVTAAPGGPNIRLAPGYDRLRIGHECGSVGPFPFVCPGCGHVITKLTGMDRVLIRIALGDLMAAALRDDTVANRTMSDVIGSVSRSVDNGAEVVRMIEGVLESIPPV